MLEELRREPPRYLQPAVVNGDLEAVLPRESSLVMSAAKIVPALNTSLKASTSAALLGFSDSSDFFSPSSDSLAVASSLLSAFVREIGGEGTFDSSGMVKGSLIASWPEQWTDGRIHCTRPR